MAGPRAGELAVCLSNACVIARARTTFVLFFVNDSSYESCALGSVRQRVISQRNGAPDVSKCSTLSVQRKQAYITRCPVISTIPLRLLKRALPWTRSIRPFWTRALSLRWLRHIRNHQSVMEPLTSLLMFKRVVEPAHILFTDYSLTFPINNGTDLWFVVVSDRSIHITLKKPILRRLRMFTRPTDFITPATEIYFREYLRLPPS